MRYEDGQLRRLQAVELGMLLEIGRVCAELNIEWFLDSGTALGAARHQGFIPWDDDIDVGMLRADYDRFLEEAPLRRWRAPPLIMSCMLSSLRS